MGMKLPSESVGGPGGGSRRVLYDSPLLHFVVDVEDGVLGDVGTFSGDFALGVLNFGAGDVFEFDDGEGFHDVVDGVARGGEHLTKLGAVGAPLGRRSQIKMEARGIQLTPQQKPPLLIPAKRRTRASAVQHKRFQVPCRVRQFENTRSDKRNKVETGRKRWSCGWQWHAPRYRQRIGFERYWLHWSHKRCNRHGDHFGVRIKVD